MSGGTYSVFRVLYAVFLAATLVHRATTVSQPWLLAVAVIGALAAVPFALGYRDRIAALVLAPAVFITGMDQALLLPIVEAAPLAVHLGLPKAPYGSLDAAGRPDPKGSFIFPAHLSTALYALLAGGYGALAVTALQHPAHEAFDWVFAGAVVIFFVAGLAVRARFVGWLVMAAALVTRIFVVDDPLTAPLVMMHLLAFDGRAVAPRRGDGPERVFYDGACGLCHRAVRFALAEDPDGEGFRFAPLYGASFEAEVDEETAKTLPDSIVLVTRDGAVLVRSAAILRMMAGLGGLWRVLGVLSAVIPRPLRDVMYDGVAAIRHKIFAKPADVCPIIPKALRPRFDA